MTTADLHWLPPAENFRAELQDAVASSDPQERWRRLVCLARRRLDLLQTGALDRAMRRAFADAPPPRLPTRPERLAVLASSTGDHLVAALRVGALRRGIWLDVLLGDYGQYQQMLFDPGKGLAEFDPTAILLAFDARHAVSMGDSVDQVMERISDIWSKARQACAGLVIQQTLLPVLPGVMGEQEHRLETSDAARLGAINARLRACADPAGVALLSIDSWASRLGIAAWHDAALWHRAKQEIRPAAASLYGELVGRILGAAQGRSAKALVLDLDNTLWGGVIGDDGLDGIVLGQGSAVGEAHLEFQRYARALAGRGVILAVCSKNDAANALAPFDDHPEMGLKRSDIAVFVANWDDKAHNLRHIAAELNIGSDALVFVDDNPAERALVRREMPEVHVPELPDDPAGFGACLADAGYFETLRITPEDLDRGRQYQASAARASLQSSSTDLEGYLRSLNLKLDWRPFDRAGLQRIVQLINKTNQFNLTTRRVSEADVSALLGDPAPITMQVRLADVFGDNGIIAILIAKPAPENPAELVIDTWLMSCRVLGRQVEAATLDILAKQALARGCSTLLGAYRPTDKNGIVRDIYGRLGFSAAGVAGDDNLWRLELASWREHQTFISVSGPES